MTYTISSDRQWSARDWHEAASKCEQEGMVLASLYSADDFEVLRAAAVNANQNVWIGANDIAVEGVWVWADGVSLAARGYGFDLDDEPQRPPWSTGEPNDYRSGEDW